MGYGARGKRSADAEADADAHYGAYGYSALPAYPALYNAYPNWPGYSLPGFSRTLYGARGKRSADADAYYGPAYAFAAYPTSHSVVASTVYGLRGKRSAEAEPEADAHYGYAGYAGHGYAGYAGYGHAGYSGYSGYTGHGYSGYPYRAAYGHGYPYRYGGY